MTTKQAAILWNVHPQTVRGWISSGLVRAEMREDSCGRRYFWVLDTEKPVVKRGRPKKPGVPKHQTEG